MMWVTASFCKTQSTRFRRCLALDVKLDCRSFCTRGKTDKETFGCLRYRKTSVCRDSDEGKALPKIGHVWVRRINILTTEARDLSNHCVYLKNSKLFHEAGERCVLLAHQACHDCHKRVGVLGLSQAPEGRPEPRPGPAKATRHGQDTLLNLGRSLNAVVEINIVFQTSEVSMDILSRRVWATSFVFAMFARVVDEGHANHQRSGATNLCDHLTSGQGNGSSIGPIRGSRPGSHVDPHQWQRDPVRGSLAVSEAFGCFSC